MSYKIVYLPEFDNGAIGSESKPQPVDSIVKSNLKHLRSGIDGFFDTLIKINKNEITENHGNKGLNNMNKQIEEARAKLAGCGVKLPNKNVNYDTTTNEERIHELGRWTYEFFEGEYTWDRKLRELK